MENLNLTELETVFLTSLIKQLTYEPHFSDVTITDICEDTGIKSRIMRGAQSSLSQKGIISMYDNGEGFVIIYLNEPYFYLHPEWSRQELFETIVIPYTDVTKYYDLQDRIMEVMDGIEGDDIIEMALNLLCSLAKTVDVDGVQVRYITIPVADNTYVLFNEQTADVETVKQRIKTLLD